MLDDAYHDGAALSFLRYKAATRYNYKEAEEEHTASYPDPFKYTLKILFILAKIIYLKKVVWLLKLFLDTANLESIRRFNRMGIVDGVTTNPTLISKEQGDFEYIVSEICKEVNGPVSVEVIGTDYETMVKEAKEYSKIAENVVIKIPMLPEGLRATKTLSSIGIPINMTLVFSANQGLLAAKAGASYVSPFIGRLDDIGHRGMQVVRDLVRIFSNYKMKAEILVGSIRHPLHVLEAAKIGANIATLPPEVMEKMISHPLTDIGLKRFLEDWEKAKKKTITV